MKFAIAVLVAILPVFVFASSECNFDHVITIQVKELGIRDAVKKLLEMARVKYEIAPQVTNTNTVNLDAKNIKWNEALLFVLKQDGLQCHKQGNKYLISKAGID